MVRTRMGANKSNANVRLSRMICRKTRFVRTMIRILCNSIIEKDILDGFLMSVLLQVIGCTDSNQGTVSHQTKSITFFSFIHDMGGHNNRRTLCIELIECIPNRLPKNRINTDCRFIKNEYIWFMQQSDGK